MQPFYLIKNCSNNELINYEIYRLLLKTNNNNLKNLKFKENIFDIENIYNDGNCFYRAISSFICTSEQYRIFFRNLVYDYINNNYNDIIVKSPYIYYNGKAIDIEDYIPMIKKNSFHAGESEANTIANLLNLIILVLETNNNDKGDILFLCYTLRKYKRRRR